MKIKYLAFRKFEVESLGDKKIMTMPLPNEYVRLSDGSTFRDCIRLCDLKNSDEDLFMRWGRYTGDAVTSTLEVVDFFSNDRDVFSFREMMMGVVI